MTDEEFHFHAETADPLEPLDNGLPGFRLGGLREVTGTFSGKLEDGAWAALMRPEDSIELKLYGPDPDLPRWKHWFYRWREIIRGTPYPTVVLAHGPAIMTFEEEHEDGGDIVFTGTFTGLPGWEHHNKGGRP